MTLPTGAKKLTRRSFTSALAIAPFAGRAQQSSSLRTRVKIDTERVIGDIDPKIYGNFIEHLAQGSSTLPWLKRLRRTKRRHCECAPSPEP
jgi:hypothetical protein